MARPRASDAHAACRVRPLRSLWRAGGRPHQLPGGIRLSGDASSVVVSEVPPRVLTREEQKERIPRKGVRFRGRGSKLPSASRLDLSLTSFRAEPAGGSFYGERPSGTV